MKKMQLLKKIDDYVFNKLDQIQQKPEFQKLNDAYASTEERIQEAIKAVLAATVILIPIFIISTLNLINSDLREKLQLKEEIITMAHEYIQEQALIKNAETKILGRTLVTDQGQLQTKISQIVSSAGADPANMQISNFETTDLEGNIVEAKMNLKYSSLSNDNLFGIIAALVAKERVKIQSLSITNNPANNLLDGLMTVYYFSKDTPLEE